MPGACTCQHYAVKCMSTGRERPSSNALWHGSIMVDPHFTEAYRNARPEDLPWYQAQPDADLIALLHDVLPAGGARVLDLGAGPAVHSIELAARGHHVVAIDAVPEARAMALGLAARRGVAIDYRVGDAIRQTPEGPFDLVFDRGFLHTVDPSARQEWRSAVLRALRVGGAVLVKCFDTRPPRGFGPPGLTARDLVATIGEPDPGGLGLELLRRTSFGGLEDRDHAAWMVLAMRLA
jgi:SAM-dependent methyltransferase